MSKYISAILLAKCLALFLFSGCATGESVVSSAFYENPPERIAIVDVTGDIRGRSPKNQVARFFEMELMEKNYRVIERQQVQRILDEQDFQVSDVTSGDEASRTGELLNVPAIAMLEVSITEERVYLTGRIVSTETGEILYQGEGRGGSGRTLATIGGAVVGVLAGSQVGSGRGTTAAMIGGGVLGGAAGDALAPQTQRVVRRAVKQMAAGVPER